MKDEPNLVRWLSQYLSVPAKGYIKYPRGEILNSVVIITAVRNALTVWRERV